MSDNQTPDQPTRADISRANGAKSKGPKTARGKAISSRNALRHGLRAKQAILPDESDPSYRAILCPYIEEFKPQTSLELDLIRIMAVARWRLNRLLSIETDMLSDRLANSREQIARFAEDPNNEKIMALVFNSLSSGSSLPLIPRHESTFNRSYNRAFEQLQILRARSTKNMNERTQAKGSAA